MGQWRVRPRHPLSNYRLMMVFHRHDPPGSLTHLFFCSPLYLAPHTRYVGQQIRGRLKRGGGNGASDPAIPSPIAFLERLPHHHDLLGHRTSPFSHSPFRLSLPPIPLSWPTPRSTSMKITASAKTPRGRRRRSEGNRTIYTTEKSFLMKPVIFMYMS